MRKESTYQSLFLHEKKKIVDQKTSIMFLYFSILPTDINFWKIKLDHQQSTLTLEHSIYASTKI